MKKVAFLVALVCLSACATAKAEQAKVASFVDQRVAVQEAVQGLFDGYARFTVGSFEAKVSEDFEPNKSEFVNAVQEHAYGEHVLQLLFTLDAVLPSSNGSVAQVRWDKNTQENGKRSGRCEMRFAIVDGTMQLAQITGESPF